MQRLKGSKVHGLGDLLTILAAVAVILVVLMPGRILDLILAARRSTYAPDRWPGSRREAGVRRPAERRRG